MTVQKIFKNVMPDADKNVYYLNQSVQKTKDRLTQSLFQNNQPLQAYEEYKNSNLMLELKKAYNDQNFSLKQFISDKHLSLQDIESIKTIIKAKSKEKETDLQKSKEEESFLNKNLEELKKKIKLNISYQNLDQDALELNQKIINDLNSLRE